MTLVGAGLLLVSGAALLALPSLLASSLALRVQASGALTCLVGFGGVVAGASAMSGQE